MLLPPEAFIHVPALAGKVIAPEKSFFRRAGGWLADLDRVARESGYPANWRLSDAEREATRAEVLSRQGQDLWVFAYGSLMWDPGIHVIEIRKAALTGFHRRFCLKSQIGRGSAEKPALMAALDEGGDCQGLALRIPADHVDPETRMLWQREMLAGSYVPRFVPVATPQGGIEAVTFLINRQSDRYVELDIDETARLIATGCGVRGTCFEYLENLAERLELLGLEDRRICALHERVRRLRMNGQ
ncbi:MAG TPA: gamma-glutamylcyclotransferase [Hyphomicrobiaceae bacterium]|nr:gamma-glutamylcyclotransferase [Hyphomicrobiaceae bacterium]